MPKKIFGSKKFLGQKKFVSKIFWLKKIWHQKNFWVEKSWVRKFFLSKKPGRVKPRGGYITPPPQKKIVGLKFCWVVLSCPKRFFVKQQERKSLPVGDRGLRSLFVLK